MLRDRFAERHPLPRVADRFLKRRLRHAEPARGDIQPLGFESGHRLGETLAFGAADQVLRGNGKVFKVQLAGLHGFISELIDVAAHHQSGRALLDDEGAHAAMRGPGGRVGFGQQQEGIAVAGVGDPHFRAVDAVRRAVAGRRGRNVLQIGAGVGLGKANSAAPLAAGQAGEKAALLIFGAETDQNIAEHAVGAEDAGQSQPAAGKLGEDAREGDVIDLAAAELLGHVQSEQAHARHLAGERVRVFAAMLHRARHRDHFTLHELAHGSQNEPPLLGGLRHSSILRARSRTMRTLIAAMALLVPLAAQDDMARARRISAEAIGIDSHIDTIQRVLIGNADISRRLNYGHADIPRLHEGGMKAPWFALWVPTYYHGAEAVRRTLDLRDAMQRVLDSHPGEIELALNAGDIERIVKSGKIAAFLSIEGGHQIDDDLAVLRMYYRMGIRSMTLSHFRDNNWADSSTDTPRHNGLTEFGKEVVREMNRLGMVVDVSHVSDKTFYDAIAASSKPVILSHSSCRALSDVPRNATDDMLRALAQNGGVIGINFGEGFINNKDAEALRRVVASPSQAPDLTGKALDEYSEREFHA